ncbi:MAG: hypothetical protein A3F68_04550 [Acidobacteria bacterium RIFCSPLOWO2_12_FULL_54_10]|nr:MAG: hypothetical protein A3F68_04550 [Acidobacteria bacterium RIFCSPLOWO2_12_FULL_54_10]
MTRRIRTRRPRPAGVCCAPWLDSPETRAPGCGAQRTGNPALDQEAVAPHSQKARRLRAPLISLDETGFLMAPLICRSWFPRSQTPIFYQRGGSYQKVS